MTMEILAERTGYASGEAISGTVSWTTNTAPRTAELRLFWYTKGKGDRDSAVADTLVFEMPQIEDTRSFSFRAPLFPPSFSGRLISLLWGLELILDPGETKAVELVIGPDARELTLDHPEWLIVPEPPKPKLPWAR
ncbi:MAG: hypothetical protein ACOYNN_03625 [Terrimicrobiaceae bacterium]|jgi:hypothetical protein